MLLRYSYEYQRTTAPSTWISDLFLDLAIPHETLVSILEAMYYNDEVPFKGRNRRYIATEMVNVVKKWYQESAQTGGKLFGGEENALAVGEMLREVVEGGSGLGEEEAEECRVLRVRVEMGLRR
jgi:nuclear pore complex protein Nup155